MTGIRLFHVSEEAGLRIFDPRPAPNLSPGLDQPIVWAVDEPRLPNYLLPRDCPRVCFALGAYTAPGDRERFFHGTATSRIVVVEAGWHDRIARARLFAYEFSPSKFRLHDDDAGYWVAHASVESTAVFEIEDVVAELAKRGAELRFAASLWPIRDAVAASTLCFSAIRMRNAQPRSHE